MKIYGKEQLKMLLLQEGMLQKELAELITQKTGKKMSANNLNQKLFKKTLRYDEMVNIADYLGYRIVFEKID